MNKGWTLEKAHKHHADPYKHLNSHYLSPYSGEGDELSSIDVDVIDVNDTIKPIDEEDANSEIESGEVVLQPSGKLFRALGKKHRYGGTPVNLPDGSFIYSNHRPLAISRQDKELFEFKPGGRKISANTPAKVLQREVDLKHHNQMIAIQESARHDDISKTSSQLMLQKNIKKLGQVAFLQEEKKGFPDGVPGFVPGTAPVKDKAVEVITQQYAQGGFVKLEKGGPKKYKGNTYNPNYSVPDNALYVGRESQPGGYDIDYFKVPGLGTQFSNGPKMPDAKWLKYLANETPERKAQRLARQNPAQYIYNASGPEQPIIQQGLPPQLPINLPNWSPSPVAPLNPATGPTPDNPDAPDVPILPYEPVVNLTPAQKASLAFTAYNAASINKYQPKRAQVNFTPVNLERINPQPALNQLNNVGAQAYAANQVLNPYIARASNSQMYGRLLEQSRQLTGQVANQNSQISNQENLYNNQGLNRTAAQNVELDSRYYDQVQQMNQNYDNEKRFANNRTMDQYMQYRTQNDSLQMQLASQPTTGTVDVWVDPQTGRISKTPRPGWVQKKQAAPLFDYNSRTGRVVYTGAGVNLQSLPGAQNNSIQQQYAQLLLQKVQNGTATEEEKKSLAVIASRMKQ